MIIKLDSYETIIKKTEEKKLILWGAGKCAYWLCDLCEGLENHITAIIDNNANEIGGFREIKNCRIPVISLKEAISLYNSNVILILALKDANQVVEQLKYLEVYKEVECYKYEELRQYNEELEVHAISVVNKNEGEMKIPKIIHYFWVGGNEIPEKNRKCIESWKKYCPDYEIKEWNEDNYDLTKNTYMYEAYKSKKWGFVPDYARLDIIYQYGGIYLDTDVEITRNIDDLLFNEAFIGWESRYFVNAGSGFGAVPKHPIIREMMEAYDDVKFINPDGTLNMIASPRYQTEILLQHGLEKNGEYQELNGVNVYPANYFSPKSFYTGINWKNENTYMIHHYDSTWVKGSVHDEALQRHDLYKYMLTGIRTITYNVVNEDLVSVLVPVYNVSKYLKECVDSILAQSYKNIEIILVDDGSTDGSDKICEEYAKKYENIKVIHKENGGLASARKAGIEVATGKYVLSVDSDDWIDTNMIMHMYSCMKDSDADFILSNMMLEFEETGIKREMLSTLAPGVYDLSEEDNIVYRQFFVDDDGVGILHGICGKMFKAELYRENQLQVSDIISRGEDAACVYPCYVQAKKVIILDSIFYHYRQRATSILHKPANNLLTNWEVLYNFMKEKCQFTNKEIDKVVLLNLKKFIYRRIAIALNDEFDDVIPKKESPEIVQTIVNNKAYAFPFRSIKKNSRIILYGAGKVGQSYCKQLSATSYAYRVDWVDSNNYGVVIDGSLVKGIETISQTVYDYIVIAVLRENQAREIEKTLISLGVPAEKIIWERPQIYYV